ncbi:hypothetical protein K227x_00740 [Rubripirellula lacrimiformis]|uniref:Uncharacterized protein n=1 Tax=Rubripirellula lacrimiformis TaxID=1930273 RepID=A0A517N3J2_9BACT|nr:hypothetical protein K227x_00740 [Rubripirellula lacrimiformis]
MPVALATGSGFHPMIFSRPFLTTQPRSERPIPPQGGTTNHANAPGTSGEVHYGVLSAACVYSESDASS